MATYVILSKLSPEGFREPREFRQLAETVSQRVKENTAYLTRPNGVHTPNRRRCALRCPAMVRTKQPAKTLSTCDRAIGIADLFLRVEKAIAKALMVSFVVIETHELVDCSALRVLAKEDHAIQTALLDRADKPLMLKYYHHAAA